MKLASHIAFIKGIEVYRPLWLVSPGFLERIMDFGAERIYIWCDDGKTVRIITEVQSIPDDGPPWKTFGTCLKLADACFHTLFETELDLGYAWIVDFDPDKLLVEQDFVESDRMEVMAGFRTMYDLERLHALIPILDLLIRDDKFFTAVQNFASSMSNHWCCLHSELAGEALWHDHESREPQVWEYIDWVPHIEIAIVQAARCVEAILGEPGNHQNQKKFERFIDRWQSVIPLDPYEKFSKTGKSMVDFYYDLFFGYRNPSAHSYKCAVFFLGSYPSVL